MKLVALICLVSSSLFAAGITTGGGGGISFPPGSGSGGGGSITPSTNNTNFILGVSTNVANMFVTNQLTVGNPLTGVKITGANGVGSGNGKPFVLWNSYTDYNTNQVFMTNNPSALYNQLYSWFAAGNVYTNANQLTKNITNRNDFNATNIFGASATSYWATALSFGANQDLVTTNLNGGTWVKASTGTNTFTSSWFPTNAVWTFQTFGAATNAAGLTNYESALVTSNGVPFDVVCDALTNLTWIPLKGQTFSSGIVITNTMLTNVSLDFPSTSVGANAALSVSWTGVTSNSLVIVTPPPVNFSLIGSWVGFATNDQVLVNFVPTAAAQNPAAGLYTIRVDQLK